MKVFVTGATGFLGRATVCRLLQEQIDLIACVRESSNTFWLEEKGIQLVVGCLTESPNKEILDALETCSHVVHLAGGGIVKRAEDFAKNNTETTRRIVQALHAVSPKPRKLVFLSSLAARGPNHWEGSETKTEQSDQPISAYGKAKLDAESELKKLPPNAGFSILRAPGIYGPGDTRMLSLYRAVRRGLVPAPRDAVEASFVYVDDCADAIVRMLDCEPSPVPAYVEDGTSKTVEELVEVIAKTLETKARVLRIPKFMLYAVAAGGEIWGRLRNTSVFLTRDKARDIVQPYWTCDSREFRIRSGWSAKVDFATGVQRTVEDYRRRGWL